MNGCRPADSPMDPNSKLSKKGTHKSRQEDTKGYLGN